MDKKKELIKKFNNTLLNLLVQLAPIIGDKYHLKFKRYIKFNYIMPINYWKKNCLIYKDQILSKDEKYFIKKNIDNDLQKNEFDEILRLKSVYKNVNNESKNNIWSYLQVLILITE